MYIRLKMTIRLGKFKNKNDTYQASFNPDSTYSSRRRPWLISEALRLVQGSQDTSFLTLDRTGDVSGWRIAGCGNDSFVCDPENRSGKEGELVFYFYYTAGDAQADAPLMRRVASEKETAALFDRVDIPVFKDRYPGVFDQPYSILLEAQGIPAEEGTVLTVEQAAVLFERS